MTEIPRPPLKGKKALVVGIANEHSIAYGCAAAFHQLEADLAITYLNEKAKAYVEPLARALDASILMPLDVARPGELEALFERIAKDWGQLDIVVHSIAWAPKEDLQGGLLDCTAEDSPARSTSPATRSSAWQARCAVDEGRRNDARDELSWGSEGRARTITSWVP
jgi:enoyl-[acyl-carrier protein] reductase I